jgi:hypothetical protein
MISKIRSGILSCFGLIIISLLQGIVHIPNLELNNYIIYSLIIQLGFLWFSISLWIVLRYDLVKLNNLENLRMPLDWLIRNIAIVSGVGMLYSLLQNREIFFLSVLLGVILVINYIVVYIRIYNLDKHDLEFIGDLHNYMISMIAIFIVFLIVSVLNDLKWHVELNFVFNFLSAMPILFLLRFLKREKKDIENKLKDNLID